MIFEGKHEDIVSSYMEKTKNVFLDEYMITVSRDGETPARSIFFYGNLIEAVEGYNAYKDFGFAKNYLTVCLYEPSGRIYTKILKRNQAGDPSFVRQNYIDVSKALYEIKDKIEEKDYNALCIKIAESFAKDNWRFNTERFFEDLQVKQAV